MRTSQPSLEYKIFKCNWGDQGNYWWCFERDYSAVFSAAYVYATGITQKIRLYICILILKFALCTRPWERNRNQKRFNYLFTHPRKLSEWYSIEERWTNISSLLLVSICVLEHVSFRMEKPDDNDYVFLIHPRPKILN